CWRYPGWIADVAEDEHGDRRKRSGEQYVAEMMVMAFQTYRESVSKIVVRASRGGNVAAFGIELPRAKYFFADRDAELASDGRRKRIFHSVVEHHRKLADNREVVVKSHFRGARKFDWNGSSVCI